MKTDVVIVGGGPSASASAMFLSREGIKPLIVEQERFPRYHIGESLTGGGGQVLKATRTRDRNVQTQVPLQTRR